MESSRREQSASCNQPATPSSNDPPAHITGDRTSIISTPSPSNSDTLTNTNNSALLTSRRARLFKVVDEKFITGFTPMYFIPIMGTGMASGLLYNFAYPAYWLQVCGIIMWGVGIAIFLVIVAFFIICMISNPQHAIDIHTDPQVAVFMGGLPMGYTTLVNFLYYLKGDEWGVAIWVLWWIAVVASLYTACITFYFALISKQHANNLPLEEFHATILLPVVTLTVVASSAGIIMPGLPSNNFKIITVVVSFLLWANAIAIGYNVILTIYFAKLFTYKVPPTQLVFTSFLPIGLVGQAAYGILLFGHNCFELFMENRHLLMSSPYLSYMQSSTSVASSLNVDMSSLMALILGNCAIFVTTLCSLFLNAFGYFLTFIAIMTCLSKIPPFTKSPNQELTYEPRGEHVIKKHFKGLIRFNKSFWAMTFPLGTMALANTEMYNLHHNFKAFRVVGAMYSVTVVLITVGCIIGVIYKTVIALIYIIKGDQIRTTKEVV